MRRRQPISVWPAVADLMTILAVVSLFLFLAVLPSVEKGETQPGPAEVPEEEKTAIEGQLREAARNEAMFQAIQRAQQIIDEISRETGLDFAADQTLQFGDDLVRFELNRTEPIWAPEGKGRLYRFCKVLADKLNRGAGDDRLTSSWLLYVEGHTDASRCSGNDSCNWWLSVQRAAAFSEVMRDPSACPGGNSLRLLPVGFGATQPESSTQRASRRIALRLEPDYAKLVP